MAQRAYRPGKTKQDKMPVADRPRVKEAEARRALPPNERAKPGTVVKWTEGNGFNHVGRVAKDEGDTVTVEYGSGNKSGRRTLDRDEIAVMPS